MQKEHDKTGRGQYEFVGCHFTGDYPGLTEFLPVSSSGHLSLYQHFTGQSGEAAGLFSILLHLGTLVAVCIAFWDTIWGWSWNFSA